MNQLGYLPKLSKIAVLVSDAKEPQDWQLLDQGGKAVAEGKTKVIGPDESSGDSVHQIDFSQVEAAGKGYTLKSGDAVSDPFDISPDLYSKLKYDAFKYFYLNRSGIELKMPFTGREDLARPAGHPKDVAACAPDTDCKYKLDVTGGWYDAGDYGKYVVNGGISVWTLMNWYERAKYLGGGVKAFADGKANIPESGNKIPDVLDEARWEVEFMLEMQVPEGQPLAGMAHHKMHDESWTDLALKPHESKAVRYLRPPSTAATLNLAATAAQAARIWKEIDPAFSKKCLTAAERAWKAAKANPKRFAPAADTNGGGPYDDEHVDDEFYWAAAELFITTEKPEYKKDLTANPHDAKFTDEGAPAAMTWQRVDALGKISLAVVPNKLNQNKYRQQITGTAKEYVALTNEEGYHYPFTSVDGKFPWGSNSSVLNNMLIAALAYDFNPKKSEFLNAVGDGMDYLLGRNAMGQSYVTGYGERPLENPHHRFWSYQASVNFPKPPPGVFF